MKVKTIRTSDVRKLIGFRSPNTEGQEWMCKIIEKIEEDANARWSPRKENKITKNMIMFMAMEYGLRAIMEGKVPFTYYKKYRAR